MRGLLLRFALLLTVVGLSGAAAFYGGGEAAWFLFGCCAFMALLGGAGSFAVAGEIRVERNIASTAIRSGGELIVAGVAAMPFRFPFAFAVICDEWLHEQTGRTIRGAALLLPFGRREIPFSYTIPRLKRGAYRLARVETMAADFLHLSGCRKRIMIADGEEALVYPEPLHEAASAGESSFRQDSLFPGGVREYAEGDSFRRIDWKSYIRRGKLMTKLPDSADGAVTYLLLDPGKDDEEFERVVGAAAGYIEYAQSGGREIRIVSGDVAFAGRSASGNWELLNRLTRMKRRSDISLRALTAEASEASGAESELVIVTGRLGSELLAIAGEGRFHQKPSILYASPKPVLSGAERAAVSSLLHAGCRFGFVPNRAVWEKRGEMPAHG